MPFGDLAEEWRGGLVEATQSREFILPVCAETRAVLHRMRRQLEF